MAKLGDEYQELVGAVAQALDPGAAVRVGVWVQGPDGRRDLDVEVRGSVDGKPYFVHIECKDWAEPVGIAVVDALDSKRRDICADRAIIYSNSGFTDPALRKATRLDIGMASALKAGDKRVKGIIQKQLICKRLSVESMRVVLYPPSGIEPRFPNGWVLGELAYEHLPLQNWLAPLSRKLLTDHEPTGTLTFRCVFRSHGLWTYAGQPIEVAAMEVRFQCSRSWMSQTVRQDVTLGMYDHIRKAVTVPDKQGYFMGWIDRDAWQPIGSDSEEQELAPDSFSISLTLVNPILAMDDSGVPNLELIIVEQDVK